MRVLPNAESQALSDDLPPLRYWPLPYPALRPVVDP